VSLLGIPSKPVELNFADDIIFKGATVQGINGRLMYKTWYQMQAMLKAGKLDLDPVITDRMPMADFSKGMDRLRTGESSKILLYPNGVLTSEPPIFAEGTQIKRVRREFRE